ncbi:hypothetical protein F4814DRAFT_458418 [Daldinia grandis]|nr:hypothetical protein F4814DRAFT_458418 [Daldinia grandis]
MNTFQGELSIPHHTYLKIQIALDVIVTVFVAVRLSTNYRHTGKLAADDYFSIVAVAVLVGYSTSSFLMTRSFESPDTTIPTITKISVACLFTGGGAMFFAKAPIFLFYIRIFNINNWLRITCYVVLTTTAIAYSACSIYSGVNCIPSSGVYDTSFLNQCAERTLIQAIVRCFISISTDIIALSLPLAIVTKLHLPLSRKIGLALVFMTGIFAMVAGCVSLYYQWRMARTGDPQDMTVAMLCTCIECSIAIIVMCAPALHSLWKVYISKSRLVTNPQSLYTYRTKKTDTSESSQQIKVVSHHYIELGEPNRGISGYQADVVSVGNKVYYGQAV